MPTVFSLTSMLVHIIIALGVNFLFKLITNDTGYVGFTIYFVVLAHGKFLLLEGIHDLRIMLEEMQKEYPRRETKADTLNKEKTDEKLG